ncbi:response regulator [Thermodesulfobacteriota bacterium]
MAVVDDDKIVRDFVATALAYSVNREIQLFSNGFDAVNSLESGQSADIILSDVYIPELNGFELLSAIKKKFPRKACILMSSIPSDEETARRLGADAFIGKPFSANALFQVVQKFVATDEEPPPPPPTS